MSEVFPGLLDAAKLGDIDAVKRFFPDDMGQENQTDLANSQDWNGETALHLAAANGMADVVEFLIKKGACLDMADASNRTPLHRAVSKGYADITASLCDAGALIDPKDKFGRTPLFIAAKAGSNACVKLLVSHGADVNAFSLRGGRLSAVQAAASGGFADVVETLVNADARVNNKVKDEESALHLAIQSRSSACVKVLLANKADVNYRNAKGETPLILAAQAGDDEIFDMLLNVQDIKLNAVSKNGETALSICCMTGYMHGVQALFEAPSIKIGEKLAGGVTLVHLAAQWKHHDVLTFLLENGCEPDAADEKGNTPLHLAVAVRDNQDVVTTLVKAGCDPSVVGNKGRNAFACIGQDDRDTWELLAGLMQDPAVLEKIRERRKEKSEKEKEEMLARTTAKKQAMMKSKEVTRTKPKRVVTQKMLVTMAMKGARQTKPAKQQTPREARPWGGSRETEKFRRDVRGQINEMKKEYVAALADIGKDIRQLRKDITGKPDAKGE